MRDTNYYRAKGSYSKPGKEAKKAKFYETERPPEVGTDDIVNKYTAGTPGQDTNWRGVKEEVDGESKPKRKLQPTGNPDAAAAKKPVMVNVNGKKTVRMEPVEREIVKEAKLKLRSENDVRAMLFDFVSEYIDRQSMPNLMKLAKVIGKKLKKDGSNYMFESVLNEKTLTPAELKKREEIAKSIEKDQPDMPMDKKMAIATAAAKRVAEMNFHQFRNQLTEEKKPCSHCDGKGYHEEDGKKMECPECNGTGTMKESVESQQKVKLKGFGPDHAKGNMGNPSARAALGKRMSDNEKARQALKDPDHNPSWANSKSRMESVEKLDELSPATHKSYQAKAFTSGAKGMAAKRMGTMSAKDAYDNEVKRHKGIETSKYLNRKQHGVKEEVELDENVKKAYELMKPTKSMDHGIAAIKKHMKVDHNTATNMAKQVMDKVKKGEFKESADLPFDPDPKTKPMKNSDGTPTKPMSRAKQLAQKAMKKKPMGEAKSFDQKFKDHLKFATSDNPKVKNYMAKKQDQRRARNAKMDPGADKKGLAISVIDRQKAYAKAKKKGIGVMDINTTPGKGGRKLPEQVESNEE